MGMELGATTGGIGRCLSQRGGGVVVFRQVVSGGGGVGDGLWRAGVCGSGVAESVTVWEV